MSHPMSMYDEAPTDHEEEDDDPQCVCGVYLSEHSMMGCPEGFQSPASWEKERQAIRERASRDAYDWGGPYDDEDY